MNEFSAYKDGNVLNVRVTNIAEFKKLIEETAKKCKELDELITKLEDYYLRIEFSCDNS